MRGTRLFRFPPLRSEILLLSSDMVLCEKASGPSLQLQVPWAQGYSVSGGLSVRSFAELVLARVRGGRVGVWLRTIEVDTSWCHVTFPAQRGRPLPLQCLARRVDPTRLRLNPGIARRKILGTAPELALGLLRRAENPVPDTTTCSEQLTTKRSILILHSSRPGLYHPSTSRP